MTDERLQDYLDGRLNDTARAEVELHLREDPELARRVEAWRKAGRALRDEDAELSAGFYARARERFEQTAHSGAPRGFRLVSWETAGLAAAVVLVAALFGPELMRGRNADHPALAPAMAEPEPGQADLPLPRDASPKAQPKAAAEAPAPAPGRRGEKKMRAALEDAEPDEEGLAPGDFAPIPEPAPVAESRADAAPPAPREALAEAEFAESRRLDDAMDQGAAEPRAKGKRESAPVVVPLAADPRLPHGLRVVEDAAERADWLAGPLARLSAQARNGRLVLVGHDGGADCGSLTVRRAGESYRVRLARPGAAAGCAFVLPRDGLAVALEE